MMFIEVLPHGGTGEVEFVGHSQETVKVLPLHGAFITFRIESY